VATAVFSYSWRFVAEAKDVAVDKHLASELAF
jgi:hypothetical protein